MSAKATLTLAAAILLSSAVGAAAQVRYYDYATLGGSISRGIGAPPIISDYPAAAGGGSAGYNQSARQDW